MNNPSNDFNSELYQALADNAGLVERLFKNSPAAFMIISLADNCIVDVNAAFEKMTGYAGDELIEHDVDTLHFVVTDKNETSVQNFKEGESISDVLIRFERKDKTLGRGVLSREVFSIKGIQYALSIIVGTTQDSPEYIRTREALRNSESQLLNALAMGRMGHWELDVASGIFTFSDSFYAIFRTTAEDMGGYTMSIQNYANRFVHPDDAYRVAEETKKALETDDPNFNRYLEHRMMYADGTPGYIAVRFFIAKNSKGETVKTYGVNQDITERKRIEEELQKTQKLESLGLLAGGIAHDFNNLLGGIFGNLDLARDSVAVGHQARKYLDRGLGALERAKDLTQQLLTFSKGGTPHKTVMHLSSLLKESGTLSLSGSNITCNLQISNELKCVKADPNQLSQVLNNVLLNARQAMPDGGTIDIFAENRSFVDDQVAELYAGDYVVVEVRDKGAGIPDTLIHKVFDPFFSTKEYGSGLGLATCYSIIRKHGGTMTITSHVNAGTTVSIYLPATESKSDVKSHAETGPLRMSGRVLVMDDEEIMRDVAEGMLDLLGFNVVCTCNGKETIEAFRKEYATSQPFDFVLLDLTVPGGIGGERTMAEILKIDPKIIGIVASGYADSPVIANPEKYGFVAKIEKPFRRANIGAVFGELCKKSDLSHRSSNGESS